MKQGKTLEQTCLLERQQIETRRREDRIRKEASEMKYIVERFSFMNGGQLKMTLKKKNSASR